MTKNLEEHLCSKMYKLKPGPEYYQLLQSAKIHFPMSSGSMEVSPQKYSERKYQCKSKDNSKNSENKRLVL